MKLSLSWILDHLQGDWDLNKENVDPLINKFNKSVAEIDSVQEIKTDLDQFTVVKVKEYGKFLSLELGMAIDNLAERKVVSGQNYLVKKDGQNWRWAKLTDLGSSKEGLVPVISEDEVGNWKKNFESTDFIIELDNKSVNHRPDLWGHRGVAREIAQLIGLKLKPIDQFLEKPEYQFGENSAEVEGFKIENKAAGCKRFSGLEIKSVESKPSSIKMATRLARVDTKPIDALVDLTNYVMWDIGQPMHAFDAEKFPSKHIVIRNGQLGEKLTLLDETELKLRPEDIVIADESNAVSLAGIMGGQGTGVSAETKSLILESANFEAAAIRKAAARAKVRTEASSRFEKGLDPNQNVLAIERYLKLLQDLNIPFKASKAISIGPEVNEHEIKVEHGFIESRIGVSLKKDFILDALEGLGFKVIFKDDEYSVVVPTYRGPTSMTIPEDVVEEVARVYGFENIPQRLPNVKPSAEKSSWWKKVRELKRFLAYSANMNEVSNYPFLDEDFLRDLNWHPTDLISVKNPVSENWKSLAPSLIPHLLKNVYQNLNKADNLSFFEFGRFWKQTGDALEEIKAVSGVWYSEKKIDFFECKAQLENLFSMLNLGIEWRKSESTIPWFDKEKSAELIVDGMVVGTAGMVSRKFISSLLAGTAFVFELDLGKIFNFQAEESKYNQPSKYQAINLDISMILPVNVTVAEIEDKIKSSDDRIYQTDLIDIFEKPEWKDKRSVAVRFYLVDSNKTLDREEIDQVLNQVKNSVESLGAEVR